MPYPIQLVLDGLRCVVVGGGKVAARKVEALRQAGAEVHVVSPEFDDSLKARDDVVLHREVYQPALLTGARLVLACTDDSTVNHAAADDARAMGALVNVADDPEHCDFYVPALVRRDPIQIAIGTGGSSPELAATIRKRIESAVPESYAELAAELGRVRALVKSRITQQVDRSRFFAELCGEESIRRFERDGLDAWRDWFKNRLEDVADA
ncbi:MAG: bifunctional precorrin-2 dehydrogenase/sirohydrochlorin ferrochelatase [Phycisphaerae bacterium]|nr:bifunctional precorrin-2 dehydrogenase/sirohydrochlorin ferrochelatase [Phycisphaerae bacterium]